MLCSHKVIGGVTVVHVSWLIEKRVLFLDVRGYTAPEEMLEVDRTICRFLQESDILPVHILINDSDTAHLPLTRHFNTLAMYEHPNIGWTMIYGIQNALVRYVTEAVGNLLGLRFQIVNSHEHALATLAEIDPSLMKTA
ncbi:MAG: hypothetical protein K8I82_09360 [Anaerolineae bacterium]|nr:hypothetical protein [Anaerolineae bacterium]